MPWATNPIFRRSTAADDVEAATTSRQEITRSIKDGFKEPTDRFTAHQLFYIFILDGVGAFILSAAINFAIAYAMYGHEDTDARPIRLWQFPNTLAGDAAVTIIVQCLITWHIELIIVNRDLKKGGVHPIGFIPEPKNRLMRWFMFLDREEETHRVRGFLHWITFLRSQILRALLVAVVCFPFIWGPTIGFLVLTGRKEGNDWYYDKVWTPQYFKLVQGGALGLLTTPFMVIFWLTRCGWALKNNATQPEPSSEERSGEQSGGEESGDERNDDER